MIEQIPNVYQVRFWIPRTKRELIKWFEKQGIMTLAQGSNMSKKQLYGKYFQVRRGN